MKRQHSSLLAAAVVGVIAAGVLAEQDSVGCAGAIPKPFDFIDAVFYHQGAQAAYFFRGSEYIKWIPDDGVCNQPTSITEWQGSGSCQDLPFTDGVDAAMWYVNGAVYFFRGTEYVKWIPGCGVELLGGNPIREIGVDGWAGVPTDLDAALYYEQTGKAYFFKGGQYWRWTPGVGLDAGSPFTIGDPGWNELPTDLNAAMDYRHNNKAYFFKDRVYYRWTPGVGLDVDYPRRIGFLHKGGGGWPGLSSVLAGPFVGRVTSTSAELWLWCAGGFDPADLVIDVSGAIASAPSSIIMMPEVLDAVEGIDEGSQLLTVTVSGVDAGAEHSVAVHDLSQPGQPAIETFSFMAPPTSESMETVRFAVGSCINISRDESAVPLYRAILKLETEGRLPHFLVLSGDNLYYDGPNNSTTCPPSFPVPFADWVAAVLMLRRQIEARNNPQFVELIRRLPVFSTWDDHDFGFNNAEGVGPEPDGCVWVGREVAASVYRTIWNHPYDSAGTASSIEYDFEWGPIHFFMTDGRYNKDSPNGVILGQDQLDALVVGLRDSSAPLKVIVFGNQVLYDWPGEGLAKQAHCELGQLMESLDEVTGDILILSGDVHHSEAFYDTDHFGRTILEVTSSAMQLYLEETEAEEHETEDAARLWHTFTESFALIEYDPIGQTVTVEARDETGVLRDESDITPQCRTVWNLAAGDFTSGATVTSPVHATRGFKRIRQKSSGRYLDAYTSAEEDFRVRTSLQLDTDGTQDWLLDYEGTCAGRTLRQRVGGGGIDGYLDAYTTAENDFAAVVRDAQCNATQRWILQRTPVANEFRIRQVGNGNDVVLPEDDRRFLDAYQTAGEDYRVVTRTEQLNDTQIWIIEDCCPADFDCSGSVGIEDLLAVLSNWGECNATCGRGCPQDVDHDLVIGITDFLVVLGSWGDCL